MCLTSFVCSLRQHTKKKLLIFTFLQIQISITNSFNVNKCWLQISCDVYAKKKKIGLQHRIFQSGCSITSKTRWFHTIPHIHTLDDMHNTHTHQPLICRLHALRLCGRRYRRQKCYRIFVDFTRFEKWLKNILSSVNSETASKSLTSGLFAAQRKFLEF